MSETCDNYSKGTRSFSDTHIYIFPQRTWFQWCIKIFREQINITIYNSHEKIGFKGIGEFSIHFCMNMICSIIRFQLNLKVKQKNSVKKWEKDMRLLWTNITVHISEGFSVKPIPPYRTVLQLQCRFPHQHFLWIKVRASTLMFQNIKFILFLTIPWWNYFCSLHRCSLTNFLLFSSRADVYLLSEFC